MRPLFCAACEKTLPNGQIEPKLFYMHVPAEYEHNNRYAEAAFRRSHQNEIITGRLRIVAVSRVIGFHALDDNGDRCVA